MRKVSATQRCLIASTHADKNVGVVPHRRSLDSRDKPGALEHHGGGNTHAWLQVYLPGAGWVEFDPTNNIVGNRDLIRVAVVRDAQHAIPLSGSWSGAATDCLGMEVAITVTSDESGRQ